MRGRVQFLWAFQNQTRADNARAWLDNQLVGRNPEIHSLPDVFEHLGDWIFTGDISFDTLAEGRDLQAQAKLQQSNNSFIRPGGYVQFHECDHDDGLNDCALTVEKDVK